MKTKLLITGLTFVALTTLVNAQDKTTEQSKQATAPAGRGAYVDANNNGVCDYYETGRTYNNNGRRMGNAASSQNRRGMKQGQGCGFGPGQGQGRGLGPGQGRGAAPGGRFYVDENKNGICDFREAPAKK